MCGIAGVFSLDPNRSIDPSTIRAMASTMVHRGPDDAGDRVGPGYGLGHQRLSIIDLSGGHQPMSNVDETQWSVVNGEIYNFRALRERLEKSGARFHSDCDSEVVVHGYEHWGVSAVEHFDGMFGFAVADEHARRLTLARDRLGIKPLYWAYHDELLIFGSEIKAILAYPGFASRLNTRAVSSYLNFRYTVGTETFFEGISALSPGHTLAFDRDGLRIKPYWEPPHEAELDDAGAEQAIESTFEGLRAAVRQRMISDVPVGAYLSGGLDSSIVVALMAEETPHPVKTFTIGYAEEGFNEFSYARQVADLHGTDHKEILQSEADYFELLPRLIEYGDAPLGVPNEVPLWQMSAELKKDVTVVLSGEGADELFCGYGRIFRSADDYSRMRAGVTGADADRLRAEYGRLDFSSPEDFFLSRYSYFGAAWTERLLGADLQRELAGEAYPWQVFSEAFSKCADLPVTRQFLWVFQRLHLPGLLQRLDKTTMATSVEGRVPFVDHHLVELGQRMPLEYRMPWIDDAARRNASGLVASEISERYDTPKWVLREAFRSRLPAEVVDRRKVGFPVPLGKWLDGEFRNRARDLLLDSTSRNRGFVDPRELERLLAADRPFEHAAAMRVWMLYNLETFMRLYFDA